MNKKELIKKIDEVSNSKSYFVELDTNNYNSDACLVKADGFDEAYKIVWDHIRKDAELTDFLKQLDVNKEDMEDFCLISDSDIYRTYISESDMSITITLTDIDPDREVVFLGRYA